MNKNKNREKLYDAVSCISQNDIRDFVKYEENMRENESETVVRADRPALRIIGGFAACALLFGGMFVGLKYLEARAPAGPASVDTGSATDTDETEPYTTGADITVEEPGVKEFALAAPYAAPQKNEPTENERQTLDKYYKELIEKFPEAAAIPREMLIEKTYMIEDELNVSFTFCFGGLETGCKYRFFVNDTHPEGKWNCDEDGFKQYLDSGVPKEAMDYMKSLLKKNTADRITKEKLDETAVEKTVFYWEWENGGLRLSSECIAYVTDNSYLYYGCGDHAHIFCSVDVELTDGKIRITEHKATSDGSTDTDFETAAPDTYTDAETGGETEPFVRPHNDPVTISLDERIRLPEVDNWSMSEGAFRNVSGIPDPASDEIRTILKEQMRLCFEENKLISDTFDDEELELYWTCSNGEIYVSCEAIGYVTDETGKKFGCTDHAHIIGRADIEITDGGIVLTDYYAIAS